MRETYVDQTQDLTEQIVMRVSKTSILANMFLTIFKMVAGIASSSGAMISDAVHSASDVFSTLIVMIGVKISRKEADKEHPYGHERMECVAAILLAAVLFLTGIGIGYTGIQKITAGRYEQLAVPGRFALIASIVSIVVKEWMFWYTKLYAKKVNCGALMADAWHHRSDALSSVGSFIGILGARLGMPVMDPAAGVVICIFIVKASYDIFKDAVDKMVDKSCDDSIVAQIRNTVLGQQGVIRVDDLITREFGNRIYVDVEIAADGKKTLRETHAIAEKVHNQIEEKFPNVKHIMVHVNPDEESRS
ncbi:Magnetosome protein MamB [Eubacterium plexicaudatum ASF492]|uniref:Cation diffusion facilitator family transporter n=1 Tax=Eubacterium plexicaudatum ASF492 TaxID=1235802 RepID=N1ZQ87_9FIRM|nr:Magnetosome protein MamB [Eubacterium plexicaudatum ASF492]